MFEISVEGRFDAAHRIDRPDMDPGYARVHGHSFVVRLSLAAPAVGPEGWVADLGQTQAALDRVLLGLDHRMLNDVEGLGAPTFENILVWIDRALRTEGVAPSRLEISRPTLGQRCVYTPGSDQNL